ncbi:GT2 family glycosyltransferase [Paenibacillus polymyxa]|uniref:glycosyltransferase family 2 protein n=1 Tax=Paenibacillus polymyxa TaxID=1406 RepID=UPI0027923283|nr:glycosyltransferase [Paenibacillus polymyxa]MDQ0048944.1 GT2 family glycosyltransferase [Paenibacillus polymyxa]
MQASNEELVEQVLGMINTLIEAAEYIQKCTSVRNYVELERVAVDMLAMLEGLFPVVNNIKEEISYISASASCENIIFSIQNILKLVQTRSEKISSKIEFELIPILQDFYYDFYFFTCVFGDKQKEKYHYANEFTSMTANRYINESLETGIYRYDISIAVLAYDKLDYTKKCVESILQFTPNYLDYELVLIDNGSTDGTSEYFESLSATKTFTLKKNSLNIMAGSVPRIFEGKYLLVISNDVIVTENYLDNLILCIESDPAIAMVVPTTPNVSNFQTIPADYSTLEEMLEFAKENNVSDPTRWEERTRLCNPLAFYRSDILVSSQGVGVNDKYFVYSEFGDDALAMRLRHAGYKMILAKDCYCHHFGSVTLKEAQVKENTLEKSRKLFMDRHGIDAWSTGFCYDEKLIKSLGVKEKGHINILGINSGFGSNPLKVKTIHREAGNQDVSLYQVSDNERYVPDLQVYSNRVVYAKDNVIGVFDDVSFDYILIESNIEQILHMPNSLDYIKSKLTIDGILAICAVNDEEVILLNNLDPYNIVVGNWYCWSK